MRFIGLRDVSECLRDVLRVMAKKIENFSNILPIFQPLNIFTESVKLVLPSLFKDT